MLASPSIAQEGYLSTSEIRDVVSKGLASLDLDAKRVLILIPDGTRTMPMPLLFDLLKENLAARVEALDYLVALGTHPPMNDAQLSSLIGRNVSAGRAGESLIRNHTWDRPETFARLGTIPAGEVSEITGGLLESEIPVSLNRMALEYDHLLICGPVFPHEVAGFSGGVKYFFPGIAGPEIIHLTHWLGALMTSYDIIGVQDTPVRRIMNRAVEFLDRPHSLIAPVVMHDGVAGIFCGPTFETWARAAELSSQRHIVWVDRPFQRVLSLMPRMYDDLWTGAKGMYKVEPAVADGGEVVIYAPHIREASAVHGRWIGEIGYHCRDYFLKQWDRFSHVPLGVLAHSTHLKGKGTYENGVETPRIRVTLATGISREECGRLNLGYLDPSTVDPSEWRLQDDWLVVPDAGEMLYRARA